MNDFKPFDALKVGLQNSNLIEASAGTGKTYSIAILVLRLVLEKKLSIREILMVTFTKAAVAELQERIRLFIRKAYKVSMGEHGDDSIITALVQQVISESSEHDVQQNLRKSVLFLDETSVLTIHSFCHLTLTEFAFETSQLFGAEIMKDNSAIQLDEINKFWRENITTIPAALLKYLINGGLTRESIQKVLKEHLKGNKYYNYEKDKDYSFCEEDHDKILSELKEIKSEEERLTQEMITYIQNNEKDIRAKSAAKPYAKNANLHLYETPQKLVREILKKRDKKYIQELYAEILSHCDDCKKEDEKLNNKIRQVINDINCQAINIVSSGLEAFKQRNNLLSYDDLIINLHKAITAHESQGLVEALRRKYKAVFVDEFQDTDRLQYQIFQKAFGTDTILFYIGDPKQSIYAFRKADIFTYFQAKEDVQHLYTMNQNFRSSENLIKAMNVFFEPVPGFDTFHFANAPEAITYRAVQSPEPNTRGTITSGNAAVVPVSITTFSKNDEIFDAVAAQIIDLLSNTSYLLSKDGRQRRIVPSDIGILVRKTKQGKKMKSHLGRYSIPAVTINDEKIMQCAEAKWLLYLLEAMIDNSRKTINKALLSPFTGYKHAELQQLNDETTLSLFRQYGKRWNEDGIFSALMDFINDFNVRKVLLGTNKESGERVIANLFQLIELLHKVQTNKQFSPLELVSWLKRGTEGMETEGDEYEQRIESDEDSVKIVTIHKSKGLEYNIVFAPFLDLGENDSFTFSSYRNPLTGEYISVENDRATPEQVGWISQQNEQENRRLVYVAITRAVYKCYLHRNTRFKNSTLATFINALSGADISLIKKDDLPAQDISFKYRQNDEHKSSSTNPPVQFTLQHNNWTKMSYSMLAKKSEPISRPPGAIQQGKYDHFVFTQLTRGNKTGNLLHQIFEYVPFDSDQNWKYVIDEALRQHLPGKRDLFAPLIFEMLEHVFNVPLHIEGESFSLSEVTTAQRIHEFEFDFPVPVYNPAELNELTNSDTEVRVSWDKPLEGIINGKLDLFFGCRGKYYILDWKSNYLGDTLTDYSPEALARAMNENNYHLQYLIYTLATKKYLQSRLMNFDYAQHFGGVIYLFVRGIRQGSNTGIYINRPGIEQLQLLEEIMEGRKMEKMSPGKQSSRAVKL